MRQPSHLCARSDGLREYLIVSEGKGGGGGCHLRVSRMCPFALVDREGATRRSYIVDHKLFTGKIAARDLMDRISWERVREGRGAHFRSTLALGMEPTVGWSAYYDLSHFTTKSNMHREVCTYR